MAAEGCDLVLTGRDEAALEEVAADIAAKGRKAAVSVLDLRQEGTEKALVEAVRREFGHLDILVNNAGATKRGSFFELTDADWADGYALKFFGHMRLVRVAWPLLKAQGLVRLDRRHRRQSPRPSSPSAARSTPRCAAFTKASPTSARATACRSTAVHPEPGRDRAAMEAHPRRVAETGRDEDAVREGFRQEMGIIRYGKVEDVAR